MIQQSAGWPPPAVDAPAYTLHQGMAGNECGGTYGRDTLQPGVSVLIKKGTPRDGVEWSSAKGHCVNRDKRGKSLDVSDPLTALDAGGGVRFQGEPRPGHSDMWDVK